jgi:hypothetical protein
MLHAFFRRLLIRVAAGNLEELERVFGHYRPYAL